MPLVAFKELRDGLLVHAADDEQEVPHHEERGHGEGGGHKYSDGGAVIAARTLRDAHTQWEIDHLYWSQ
jgi:hypothetical protein